MPNIMKKLQGIFAALALCGLAACDHSPKTFTGTIADASMNTVTVQGLDGGETYTFSTMNADRSEANGLLLGAPIVVDYTGKLGGREPVNATKVATDPTYAEAVARWTMPDPNDPETVIGIEIEVEGVARSINMATLQYTAWELQDEAGRILLKGKSIGNGQTIDFTQTGIIARNAEGRYTLSIEGTDMVLAQEPL